MNTTTLLATAAARLAKRAEYWKAAANSAREAANEYAMSASSADCKIATLQAECDRLTNAAACDRARAVRAESENHLSDLKDVEKGRDALSDRLARANRIISKLRGAITGLDKRPTNAKAWDHARHVLGLRVDAED